jgi:hypothetical protein
MKVEYVKSTAANPYRNKKPQKVELLRIGDSLVIETRTSTHWVMMTKAQWAVLAESAMKRAKEGGE